MADVFVGIRQRWDNPQIEHVFASELDAQYWVEVEHNKDVNYKYQKCRLELDGYRMLKELV